MSKIIPNEDETVSDWGTHNFYFFEFVCKENYVYAQFALYGVNTISDGLYSLYKKINEKYKRFEDFKNKKFTRRFASFYDLLLKTEPVEIKVSMSDEEINHVFEDLYAQLMEFEKDFIAKMSLSD